MLNEIKDLVFDVRLYATDTSGDEEFFDRWYRLMPADRRARCDRFRQEADRNRCVTAYALLSYALGDLTGKVNAAPVIKESADGKPYLADHPIYFNISHAGERVVVALSPMEVGCDVECKNTKALPVAQRFFSKNEYRYLLNAADEEKRSHDFTRLWTMKESVVKCLGEGIRRAFSDFSVVDDEGRITDKITLEGQGREYHLREYESENGYCYSLCSVYGMMEERIRRICTDQMM